jgi:glucokinase
MISGMILAGDVGGTKSLLGIFQPDGERPRPTVVREFATTDFDSLAHLVTTFLDETGATDITSACFGVAGPVHGMVARLTNVPWLADASPVAEALGCPTRLMNDLEAMASAVPLLGRDEVTVLQEGEAQPDGNAALIAAGTGLGEAMLHNVDGRFIPAASEGGHADFAPRTLREFELAQYLLRTFGRVENERIISGPGLINVYRFTHLLADDAARCHAVGDVDDDELPAAITGAAMSQHCPACGETLEIFVEAYGSEAGNLALRHVATAGVWLGGGIAPKILPALTDGRFVAAFRDKPPMTDLLRTVPVTVILNAKAGLLGAAVGALPGGARAAR